MTRKVKKLFRRLAGHGESTKQIKRMVTTLRQNKIKTTSGVIQQIRSERQELASYCENVLAQNVIRRNKNLRGDSHLGQTQKL